MTAWRPYVPSDSAPWNLRRVAHLHRRAGFAATWRELRRDLEDGPASAIRRVLSGKASVDGVLEDFEALAPVIGDAAAGADDPNRLKAWWLFRMLQSPDPLTERMTLLWHNHFATSNRKVDDVALMRRQNETFREFARSPFGELLRRVAQDPAMLIWLDARSNRKGRPNENLAREIMELFTLGVGNYTERDVKEAARALTGSTVRSGRYRHDERYHDDGEKTILGKTGRWRGDDLVRLLLDQPATARRLAERLCEAFMGEQGCDEHAIAELATGLREHDLDIGWAVETVLRSEAFFADGNIGNRVLGPIEFVVGAVRALELFDPPPSTLLLGEWTGRLGQDLFYPPNVFGWPGGRAWLTSRAMIGRANFASALVEGNLYEPRKPHDSLELAKRHGIGFTEQRLEFYRVLMHGNPVAPGQDPTADRESDGADASEARRVVASLLVAPEAQLG